MNSPHSTPPPADGAEPFDLFNLPPEAEQGTPDEALTLTERFEQFHADNGHVYDTLVRLARRYYRATSETKQSVQRLVEIARWDEKLRTKGAEGFEINNCFRPFYARLIMFQEADLAGIFELRRADEADQWIAIKRHVDGQAA